MKIEAIPNIGIIINGKEFNWGNDRNFLRESLNNLHKEDDNIFEMSDFFVGDTSYDIIQKRDIYENTTELLFLPVFYFPFPIQVLLQFVLFHRHAVCPL